VGDFVWEAEVIIYLADNEMLVFENEFQGHATRWES